jgi:regulator of RNase E activity RraA
LGRCNGVVNRTSELVRRLAWLDTTAVSDALEALGLPSGIGGLRAQWGSPRLAGVARTVALEPDRGDAPGPHIAARAIAAAGAGDVVVVANGGRTDVSCWGGLLSLGSASRRLAGVVVDGVCRDVAEAEALRFPVFARGTIPRTARTRLRERAFGSTVMIAGVEVADGDLVVADASGVAFVPQAHAAQVIGRAEAVSAREAAIAEDIRDGASITEAMHDSRLAGQISTGTHVGEHSVISVEQQLRHLPTAAISDALDRLGLPGSLRGIGPLREGRDACGPAYTVAYEPVDSSGGTVGDFLDDVPAGAMIVIENAGRTDCTVWGGILTQVAHASGVAGTIVHGACRDTATSAMLGYPIWSAGRFMRTGKDRVRLAAVQLPVIIDGVTITPADLVRADDDGVLVVPAASAEEVARLARGIETAEARILTAVQEGARLVDARAVHGYHALQTAADDNGSKA